MPALGRWGAVDPLTDETPQWSPYNYVFNNPPLNIDPDGRQAQDPARLIPTLDPPRLGQFVGAAARGFVYAGDKVGAWISGVSTARDATVVGFGVDFTGAPQNDDAILASALGLLPVVNGTMIKNAGEQITAGSLRTLPNTTRGWNVGDPINNLTARGNVPAWSTVKARYWKNAAAGSSPGTYSEANLARMRQGLAPQRINPQTGRLESMELHRDPPQRDGGLFDVQPKWPGDHADADPMRKLKRE